VSSNIIPKDIFLQKTLHFTDFSGDSPHCCQVVFFAPLAGLAAASQLTGQTANRTVEPAQEAPLQLRRLTARCCHQPPPTFWSCGVSQERPNGSFKSLIFTNFYYKFVTVRR
jgi:hypothetical protein